MEAEKPFYRATLIFILALILIFSTICQSFAINERADYRYARFWDDPGEYDVWFVGSSHVYYSIQPMRLYKDYGFTSYDIASPSCTIPLSYWVIMNALKKATPKLIVVDGYHIDMEEKMTSMSSKSHQGLDRIPYSDVKTEAVKDLFDSDDERVEYLFRQMNTETLEQKQKFAEDTMYCYPITKGAKLDENTTDLAGSVIVPKNETLSSKTTGCIYLQKIIDECEKRNINLIITAMPYVGEPEKQKGLHTAIEIAKKNDCGYIDLQYCPDLLDYNRDFSKDGHPNYTGSCKITDKVGEYISANYALPDHRGNAGYKAWNNDQKKHDKISLQIKKKIKKSSA